MAGPERRCVDCPTFLSVYNEGDRCARCEAAAEVARTPPPWDPKACRTSQVPRGFTLEPYLATKAAGQQAAARAKSRRQAAPTVNLPSTGGCTHAG